MGVDGHAPRITSADHARGPAGGRAGAGPAGRTQPRAAAHAGSTAARSGDPGLAAGPGRPAAARGRAATGKRPDGRADDDGQPARDDARLSARARSGGADAARRAWPGLGHLRRRAGGLGRAEADPPGRRVRSARLRPRVAGVVGDHRLSRAHDRVPARDRRRSPARGRAADGLRAARAARLRDRQHRRLPAVRLAAAAQARRARLSARVPDRPAGARARADPAGARRRALPGGADGDRDRPLLVRLVGSPGRLVLLRGIHPQRARDARDQPARRLPGRARLRRRAGRARALRGLAASGAGHRRAREQHASARRLAALALSGGRLALAVHGLGRTVLRGRHPAAAADRDPRRRSRGHPPAAPGRQRDRRSRPRRSPR